MRNQHVYMHLLQWGNIHSMRGWKSPTRMVSDMDALMVFCVFNLCDVRMRIAITCIVPRRCLRDPLKKSRFLGVVLSGGKSVKKELNISQNIWYVLGTFVQILCKIKTCTNKDINVISMFLSVNGLDTLQYTRYRGFWNSSVFLY